VAALCLIAGLSAAFCFQHRYILYYGDAQAHLDISRSIIDSRTPGYEQIGTVWLPVLHVICLPFVGNDWLWSTGLAGTVPVAVCFVIAGTCLYLAAKSVYGPIAPALAVLGLFALNPNLLYLASIPMTEVVFWAGVAVELLALLRYREKQDWRFLTLGIVASWWMSLTRYDGWFLIPFLAAGFAILARRRRAIIFISIAALDSLAPLYWAAHNWWETGNPLDFYNGPYSAAAIQGSRWYPGFHDWPQALHYYLEAGALCAGWPLLFLGVAGLLCAIIKRRAAPLAFLLLVPAFYVWSVHSSKTPIFVPQLWPHAYYNTRYGIAIVVVAAFAVGAIVAAVPKWRAQFASMLVLIAISPWLIHPLPAAVICWKESQVNSVARRAWTDEAASFLNQRERRGQGIVAPFGDITGIFCRARIPLSETLHEGTLPAWLATLYRPDLAHEEEWAVAQKGDPLSQSLERNPGIYHPVDIIRVTGAPDLIIYQRNLVALHP
jgi:hypothetical protein